MRLDSLITRVAFVSLAALACQEPTGAGSELTGSWISEPGPLFPTGYFRRVVTFGRLPDFTMETHHYGTLADEPIDAPIKALAAARVAAGIMPERFRLLLPGEVWRLYLRPK